MVEGKTQRRNGAKAQRRKDMTPYPLRLGA
jgi:hypothetical protein